MNIINASSKAQYLSNVIEELPKDCIFDKGKVGCGGTTLALTSKENYVIAVPFVSLIENKINQKDKYDNVLGVYEKTTKSEIKKYLTTNNPKHIIVTYDSLVKLFDYIDPKEYNLLIDEYHLLFTQYSFRRNAAQTVLNNYREFKSYCFMTATVLEEEFLLDELKQIPIVKVVWEDVKEVVVNSIKCDKDVLYTIKELVNRFLNDESRGNAYIFVNSVDFIKDVIEQCNLNESNCRVIYSKSNKTQLNVTRGTTTDEPKRINLLTSTVFEGADIYDENGKIFIVSDRKRKHTLTDISTSFQQIAGRIRNTKYWNEITHIFTETRYSNKLSYNEFKQTVDTTIKTAEQLINIYNNLPEIARTPLQVDCSTYLMKEGDLFSFDSNLAKIDLYNFKICNCIYKARVNVSKALQNKGYDVKEYNSTLQSDVVKRDKKNISFKECVDMIESNTGFTKEEIFKKYNWLKEAIDRLGIKKIKELKYVQTNIKRELVKLKSNSQESKIVKYLQITNKFQNGKFITAKEAKETISKIYKELNVTKTANIKDYYEVKESQKRIDGEVTKGYIIIIPKLIVK
jgi:hypothetical protein